MSEQQPLTPPKPDSVLNTIITSRRRFLQASAAIGALAALSKSLPTEAASPEANEASPPAWPEGLPVVKGETAASAVETVVREPLSSVLTSLRTPVDTTNVRSAPGTDKPDIGDFTANNLIKILHDEDDPDTNDWARVVQLQTTTDPVTGEIALKNGLEGSFALNLTVPVQPDAEGNISFTDPVAGAVTLPLTANIIYTETTEQTELTGLPISISEFPASEFPTIFEGIGGPTDTDTSIAQIWASETAASSNPLVESWKRAVGMTVLAKPEEQETETRSINICELVGETELNPCNFYRVVDEETGDVDVVSRMSNLGDEENPDLFVITKVKNDPQSGQKKVDGVGFVSSTGFQIAYGEQATEIAHSVTAIAGEQVVDLVQGITELAQMRVFLAGMDSKNRFVPPLAPLEKRFRTLYLGEAISPSKVWQYERTKAGYKATLPAVDRKTDTDIVIRQSLYVPDVTSETGEWVNLPQKEILEAGVTRYATALGFTGQEAEITARLEPRYINKNGFTLIEMFDPETGIPVMDGKKEAGKEVEYTVGMEALVKASGVHLGFSFPSGEVPGTAEMIFNEGDSITPLTFAHAQLSPSEDVLVDPNAKAILDGWFKYAEEYDFRLTPGNYLSYAENFAQWLKDSNKTPEQMMEYHKKWNSYMISTFPQSKGWYFNEWLGVYNGTKLFNNKVFGGEMEPLSSEHFAAMEELFVNAQTAAKEVEKITGIKPAIGLNDYVGNVAEGNTRDNAVTGPKTNLIFEVASYFYKKGLLNKVGLQFGFDNEGAPSAQDVENSVKPFIDAGIPIEITEMMGRFTPEEWGMMVSTLLKAGVSSINIYRINGEKQLFQENKPTADYYAVRKAYSDFVFGQRQN